MMYIDAILAGGDFNCKIEMLNTHFCTQLRLLDTHDLSSGTTKGVRINYGRGAKIERWSCNWVVEGNVYGGLFLQQKCRVILK